MQYKVPQHIDLEDKIIGPLTLQQFLYLIFGGLIDYIAYQYFYENARGLFFLIVLPTSLLALGLAFVKVYDRPMGTFIKNAISFVLTPRERLWHKEESLEGTSVITKATVKKQAAPPKTKQLPASQLENLSRILDTTGRSAPGGHAPQSVSNQTQSLPDGQNQTKTS